MAGYQLRPWRAGDTAGERLASAEWSLVAAADDGTLAGWASLRSWTEDDGVRVFLTLGHVRPADRRRGLGGMLLDATEEAAARLAAQREPAGPVMLGGNADDGEDDRVALLTGRGYARAFTMVWMRREASSVPLRDLPEGIAVRAATVDDAGALWRLAQRAWAGRPFVSLPPAERLREWLGRSDRSSFLVATSGERLAGFVAVQGDEVEDVGVDPDFQRRGLASALLTRALADHGGAVRLRTEAHDPAGARTLYERLGFRVVSSHHRYRKPLRQER
ncbi:Acetyltransferase (GNAT) family protein [Actinoplanes philippinensis]|uniref:Acetyltransferase (GNAT) family protein n=2 Tax=Actinoplanes philippinensis TaxID=35752 RepID=A0A1I2EGH0_9ACTN|nr:GNAT family N-acetyltransferase [Actinoplanes philippinensis]SFE91541.1 Acetyltransferase (GNAT) family protein [Actinoplanes philippinensis]